MVRSGFRSTTSAPAETDDLQFLRVADVCALLRISRPTLWRLRRANEFPAPTCLSRRSIGWLRKDVASWTRSRAQGRLATGAQDHEPSPQATATEVTRRAPPPALRPLRRKRDQLALGLHPPA